MIIAVDAVGGDHYPEIPIEGGLKALNQQPDLNILFVGPQELIKSELNKTGQEFDPGRVDILNADEIITMDDSASSVLKEKRNSSISVGIQAHKSGVCDAFVSAGNTGALLAASTFILGKIEGVIRPSIGTIYPTINGVRLLIDAGANLELKPDMYYQFAVMGSIFVEEVLEIDNPKVGLVNVGEEQEKGTELLRAAHQKLKALDNFIGNIEGKDILAGKADVFLTDGFTGNIILKFGESIPSILKKLFNMHMKDMPVSEETQQQIYSILAKSMHTFDYEHVGGIPFLGVNGVSLVGHGGSSANAIKNMILNASHCIENKVNQKIRDSLN